MITTFPRDALKWTNLQTLQPRKYDCAYCDRSVSSEKGYALSRGGNQVSGVFICPQCSNPTFAFPYSPDCVPSVAFGRSVEHLPKAIHALYEEARACTSTQCFTGAVLLLRKLLMNVAVQEGAPEGLKFIEYVNHLETKGFIPPNGRKWVDHIRQKGNEATHEIVEMKDSDAKDLLTFMEMLLRFIYEFPNKLDKPA